MSDDQKRIELTRMVLGKDWEPRTNYPATWHSPRRHDESAVATAAVQSTAKKDAQSSVGRFFTWLQGVGRLPR